MIKVFDDRIGRQSKYLNLKDGSGSFVWVAKSEDIDSFRDCYKEEGYLEKVLEGCSIICVHKTSLFDEKKMEIELFKEKCKSKNIPIVMFSGGNSSCSTIDYDKIYVSDVRHFYKRLNALKEHPKSVSRFIFGDEYYLSRLFLLKRMILEEKNNGFFWEFLDKYDSIYQEPEFKKLFEFLGKMKTFNEAEDFVKNEISRLL